MDGYDLVKLGVEGGDGLSAVGSCIVMGFLAFVWSGSVSRGFGGMT